MICLIWTIVCVCYSPTVLVCVYHCLCVFFIMHSYVYIVHVSVKWSTKGVLIVDVLFLFFAAVAPKQGFNRHISKTRLFSSSLQTDTFCSLSLFI